jgi:hypothetical protein
MKKIVLAGFLLFQLQIYGQLPKDVGLSQKVFSSSFTAGDHNWPQVNNEFYFFLAKDSNYIMECNSSDKKAYLLPKASPKLDSFKVEADILPDRNKGDDGVVGLAINIQDKISGGYLVEINNKKQYRVVSIDGNGNYSAISNRMRGEGWVKYSESNDADFIHLSVIQLGAIIYVSLENDEIFRFDNPISIKGQNGLFISGKYKTRIRNFAVYAEQTETNNTISTGKGDLTTLNNALLDCRKENKELADKLDISKQEIAEARFKNKELQTYISQNLDIKLQEELKKQKEIADKLQVENERLKNESEDLRALKKTIEDNKDADLVMVLSGNLKKEQQKNAELEKKIKQMSKKKGK